MRIGLNGTAYDAMSSGARDRFLRLYGEAAKRGEHEFVVYSPADFDLAAIFPGPVAAAVAAPFTNRSPVRRFLASRRWFAGRARRDRLDLFVTDHFPVLGTPTLLTIHDLRFLVLPGEGSTLRRLYFRARYAKVVARATRVAAVSEAGRGEILERLGLPAERVVVVPNGVGGEFRPRSPEAVAALRARSGLPERYLLAVGVQERRKNLGLLLRLLARDPDLPPVVLSGRGGPEARPLRREAERAGVADRWIDVGYTEDPDLTALYTGAAALLMPSRYEGFGLPILEAFACGVPVVASDIPAHREVAGDAARLADPDDEEGWAAALAAPPLPEEAGRARAARMTWSSAADRLRVCLGP